MRMAGVRKMRQHRGGHRAPGIEHQPVAVQRSARNRQTIGLGHLIRRQQFVAHRASPCLRRHYPPARALATALPAVFLCRLHKN
jgi:hypothetical protein